MASEHRSRRGLLILGRLLILLGLLLIGLTLVRSVDPLVRDMASAGAKNRVTRVVQTSVLELMAAGDYGGLVTLEKGEDGSVTAALTDMRALNELQAGLTEEVTRRLSEPGVADLSVPIGNLLPSAFFSGMGPKIPIRILSVTETEARLSSRFTDAGINQTLHRVLLELRAQVRVLVPAGTVTAWVYTDITLSETVIVGRVPESYMYFESGEEWDEPLEMYDILS